MYVADMPCHAVLSCRTTIGDWLTGWRGFVQAETIAAAPLELGERVMMVPFYSDATMLLHRQAYAVRGGVVEVRSACRQTRTPTHERTDSLHRHGCARTNLPRCAGAVVCGVLVLVLCGRRCGHLRARSAACNERSIVNEENRFIRMVLREQASKVWCHH